MNMMKLMKQAATMQKDMKKKQKQLASEVVEFTDNSGKVTLSISCDMKPKKLTIDPKMIENGDMRQIENTIMAAIKGALDKAQDKASNEMKSLTDGMDLPF